MFVNKIKKVLARIQDLEEQSKSKEEYFNKSYSYLMTLDYSIIWRMECAMLVGMELDEADAKGFIRYHINHKPKDYDVKNFEKLADLYGVPVNEKEGGCMAGAVEYMLSKVHLIEYLQKYLVHLEDEPILIAKTVPEAIAKIKRIIPEAIIYTKYNYDLYDEVLFTIPGKMGYAIYYYTKGSYCGLYGTGETYDYVCEKFA